MFNSAITSKFAILRDLEVKGWSLVEQVPSTDAAQALLAEIGPLVPQYDGKLVYDVKHVDGHSQYRMSKSTNTIGPHTEAPIQPTPPRYLALRCNTPAACGSGATILADSYRFLQTLTPSEINHLFDNELDFRAKASPIGNADLSRRSSILSVSEQNKIIVRFSHNLFFYGDINLAGREGSDEVKIHCDATTRELIQRALAAFYATAERIFIPRHNLLIWDNHRMIHWREAYQDKNRHLTRFWLNAH